MTGIVEVARALLIGLTLRLTRLVGIVTLILGAIVAERSMVEDSAWAEEL